MIPPPEKVSDPEWPRLEALFAAALPLPPVDRDAFLDHECAGDDALRRRLRDLLDAHEALDGDSPAGRGFLGSLDSSRAALLLDAEPDEEEPVSVGRYRIVRRIGAGGMGRIYLAHDPGLDRPVALKLLPRFLGADPAANRRFVEEARAASRLDHPHIGTVYEIGETADGRLFIAMAYYEGGTLRDRLAGGPLPVSEAVAIAAQVADGLAAAHAAGIVHRDVKPENLVFDGRDRVRIVDFGVAKVASAAMTRTGATLGTAAYMSPEQTRGGAVDARSDLWSLGVVLYEMLAGRRPFAGENTEAVIFGIRNDDAPPLGELRPEVPQALAEVVERCLQKDPASRFADAAELGAALRGHSALGRSAEVADPALAMPSALVAAGTAGYLALAAALFLAAGRLAPRYLLPEWLPAAVLVLALLGLPVLLATARRRGGAGEAAPRRGGWSTRSRGGGGRPLLTGPRALAGGAAAFLVLIFVSGFVVTRGVPRVTEARGTAGDAFRERGWVVVADFDAAWDAADVVLAAREALTVDLQQSGFVNVLGRAQVAAILRRMDLPDTARLELPLALEVAERAGAGVVLTASVSRLGPQYVLSGRGVRTGSGEELFAVRTAAGADRLLGGVERLSREMRRRLGEEREAIRRSRPLPEVSTASLEALRLYAEAERARSDDAVASRLVDEALDVDPGFAMAHRLAGAIAHSQMRIGDANRHLTRAYELRDRLTDRERRHVEAIYHFSVSIEPRRAADAYRSILHRDPDDWRAAFNLGSLLQSWLEDHDAAFAQFASAGRVQSQNAMVLGAGAEAAFMAGRIAQADSIARAAEERGLDGLALRWRSMRAFAVGDGRGAVARCDSLLVAAMQPLATVEDREVCGSIEVAAGRLEAGIRRLSEVEAEFLRTRRFRNVAHVGHAIARAHEIAGRPAAAAAHLERIVERIPADSIPEPDRFLTRTNLQLHAAMLGRPELVARIGAAYPPPPDPDHWLSRLGDGLVRAAGALSAGDGEGTLRILDEAIPTDRYAIGWLIWQELLRGMAYEAMGRPDSAAVHYRRAADPRYQVNAKMTKNRVFLPVALQRLAAAEAARGDAAGAERARRRLAELWAVADPGVARRADGR
jgi:tetratricopeptide (TPR) repeat protein